MRHVHLARMIALPIALAVLLTPVAAMAEEEPPPAVQVPVVPAAPVAATPSPAPVVIVRSYATSSERLLVGSAFDLTVTVFNATGRKADNVVVSLGAAGASAAAGAAGTAAGGLTVLGTGNAKYLGLLKGQREAAVTFQVIAGPGTTPGALSVPVTVSFEHEGVRQDVTYAIGLLLERDVALSLVTADLPETVLQDESFDASFEVGNASGFPLAGVMLSVEASGGVVTDGTIFLGTMDAAATESIDVSILAERPGPLEVMVVVSYRDDFGRAQTFSETRTVQVDAVPEPTSNESDDVTPDADAEEDNWFVAFFKALFGLGS